MNAYKEVTEFFDKASVNYDIYEHDPVVTVDEADKQLGRPTDQGIKALLLKVEDGFVLCAVRGSNKLDYKKLRKILGIRKLRFATPEEVVEIMGVEIGACYPLGNIIGVPMLVDETLQENEYVVFSPGVHTKHIGMNWSEYKRAVNPRLVDLKQ